MKPKPVLNIAAALAALALSPGFAAAQSQTEESGTVHVVVTAEPRHKHQAAPHLNREDVMVFQGDKRAQVTDWTPLVGDRAALEFFLLIDESLSSGFGSQLGDLRAFLNAQPPSTAAGVGYLRDGTVEIVQNLTAEHSEAAKKVRLPLGVGYASPYLSLSELLKRWPRGPRRREVLMISNGLDPLYDGGPSDPYVEAAIADAQRAGVVVYTMYASGAGHFGHSYWRINWGQNYLSRLADLTGGEAYFQGFETPVSLAPFLDDLSRKLEHQYLLGFSPAPEKKSGMRRIKLKTEVPDVELLAPQEVYVPAGSSPR